jgi:hypothetical protein
VELAEIELRKFNVRLNPYVAARLPALMVDPILIEQVLVNLLRNAAEAIDMALRQTSERIIELRVLPKTIDDKAGDRVFGTRHRQGFGARSHGPAVRGFLLHQVRRHGHRTVFMSLDCRIAPGADDGREPLQWQRCDGVPVFVLDTPHRGPHGCRDIHPPTTDKTLEP